VLEALFDLATASAQAQAAEALPVFCLPDQLESVSPSGAEQEPLATPPTRPWRSWRTPCSRGGLASQAGTALEGATGAVLLAFILYYHG